VKIDQQAKALVSPKVVWTWLAASTTFLAMAKTIISRGAAEPQRMPKGKTTGLSPDHVRLEVECLDRPWATSVGW